MSSKYISIFKNEYGDVDLMHYDTLNETMDGLIEDEVYKTVSEGYQQSIVYFENKKKAQALDLREYVDDYLNSRGQECELIKEHELTEINQVRK